MNLLAGVVTHRVERRINMDARKAKMAEEMIQYMQMGKESKTQCAVMKSIKGMDEQSGDAQQGPSTRIEMILRLQRPAVPSPRQTPETAGGCASGGHTSSPRRRSASCCRRFAFIIKGS